MVHRWHEPMLSVCYEIRTTNLRLDSLVVSPGYSSNFVWIGVLLSFSPSHDVKSMVPLVFDSWFTRPWAVVSVFSGRLSKLCDGVVTQPCFIVDVATTCEHKSAYKRNSCWNLCINVTVDRHVSVRKWQLNYSNGYVPWCQHNHSNRTYSCCEHTLPIGFEAVRIVRE